jgi:hypothetical protein
MPFTYANAQQFLRDYNRQATSQQDDRVLAKIINDANRSFHSFGEWDFDKRTATYTLAAPYNTGTVDVTNGSATVTGTGTTFTSAMVDRYIRIAGAAREYRISAYSSATSITIETTYTGDTATGQTYNIVDERKALPTSPIFRTLCQAQIDDINTPLEPSSDEQILYLRKFFKEVSFPRCYGIEWSTATALVTPAPYLWVYPAPSRQYILDISYYIWPTEMTSSSDVFQIPYAAEGVLREFMLAFLYNYQRDPNWSAQLGKARREAEISLAGFRAKKEMGHKQDWNPSENASWNPYIDYFAPGQPADI